MLRLFPDKRVTLSSNKRPGFKDDCYLSNISSLCSAKFHQPKNCYSLTTPMQLLPDVPIIACNSHFKLHIHG